MPELLSLLSQAFDFQIKGKQGRPRVQTVDVKSRPV